MLRHYFEIISREQWKPDKPYRQEFQKSFDKKAYQQVAPKLFDLFRRMNGGKLQKTLVFDFVVQYAKPLNSADLTVIAALLQGGYTVDKISYQTGKALKDGKEVKILDILNSLESKIKTKDKMKEVYEKTKNPAIEKQLKMIEHLDDMDLIVNNKVRLNHLTIFQDKNKKIVITYDFRAIASQSTEVGWNSCMNLDEGMYREYVGKGTAAGIFIAYLVEKGDEYELKNPTARVVLKPFKNIVGDIYWQPDKIYGTAPVEFREQVSKILEPYQSDLEGEFNISDDVYNDTLRSVMRKWGKESQEWVDKVHEDRAQLKDAPESVQVYFVSNYDKTYPYIQNPSENVKIAALHGDFTLFKTFKNPSEEVQLAAVHRRAFSIKYITYPTEEVQLEAVRRDPHTIGYLPNASEDVQYEAVSKNGAAIQFIENPSERIQMLAIEDYPLCVKMIKHPTRKVLIQAIKGNYKIISNFVDADEELQLLAMSIDKEAISWIHNPTPKVKALAGRV